MDTQDSPHTKVCGFPKNLGIKKDDKKMIDKKAVSLLISYVLLVSFAVIMGVLVYNWMKPDSPPDLNCPEGTSLFIKDAYCYDGSGKFNLTLILENNGRFDIAGFYIHATNSSSQTLATIDLSTKMSTGGTRLPGTSIIIPFVVDDLGPGETTQEIKFDLSEGIYSIEVTPVRYQGKAGKEKYVSCGDAKVKQKINCGEFDPLSLTGLVSWWRFEDNSDDEMKINDGITNGVTWRTGKSGQSAYFDGDDYITVLDDDSLDITGNISIAVWVNATLENPSAVDTILHKKDSGSGYLLEATHNNRCDNEDKFNLEYGTSSNICSNINVNRNNWQYLVVTYNLSDALFYINGVFDSSEQNIASTSANSNNLFIGWNDGANPYFEGQLDELMIFNRTLSPAEITQLYNYLRA